MKLQHYFTRPGIALIPLFLGLYFYGDAVLFILAYMALFMFVSFRALQSTARKRTRFFLILAYFIVMYIQIVFYARVVAGNDYWLEHPLRKLYAIVILTLPMVISRYVAVGKYTELYLPSLQETVTISFSQVFELAGNMSNAMGIVKKTGSNLSPGNLIEIVSDLPRHDSFSYINSGCLTEEYFRVARASLDDHSLYIIVSDTGSPASEIISVFTQKQFNHASLSFDAALQTIISYNGGERVYPPGLNHELLEFLSGKPDASILVYRLPVTLEQKKAALDKVALINQEGSAYNILGLVINYSYKPNIMYCSQFVYSLLDYIGAAYFKATGTIRPTDLIEKDYYRKLEFVKELRL